MPEKVIPVQGHMTAKCAGAGYAVVCAAEDYLTEQPPDPATPGEKPHTEFMFGGDIEMGTRPSLTLWIC